MVARSRIYISLLCALAIGIAIMARPGNRARDNYHLGHVMQLSKLYEITGEPALKEYSDRFAAYAKEGL